MKVSVKDEGACRKLLTIEVPAEKVGEERDQVVAQYKQFASVPGFRKGRAPISIVKKRFAKEIADQTRDQLVPKYYRQAVEEQELDVVTVVNATEPSMAEGEKFEFVVTVDVPPEFKLPKYEGIAVKDEKEEVTDERVEETLTMMRRQYASYEDIEGRAVVKDDMAELTYEATIDGQPLAEVEPEAKTLGKGEGWWMMANEDSFLPGLGDALVGMNIGDSKEVDITFRDEFVVKSLGGKTAKYNVTVTGIREQKMPELNEEFMKQFGVDSEEGLRDQMRGNLEDASVRREQARREDEIIQFLLKKTKIEVPESMVQSQARNAMYELYRQRMSSGMNQADINSGMEDLMSEAQEIATDRVKLRFITKAIAKGQGLEVSAQEVQEEIAKIAVAQRADAAKLRAQLEERGELGDIEAQVIFRKALDYLRENAKVK
ncbi:trigger factor [Verrucomicrobiota bacterium]